MVLQILYFMVNAGPLHAEVNLKGEDGVLENEEVEMHCGYTRKERTLPDGVDLPVVGYFYSARKYSMPVK